VRGVGPRVPLAWIALATLLVAWSTRPGGPWWASLLGAGLVWPTLVRAPPWRGAGIAALVLAPVPASAFEGLRVLDPGLWVLASAAWALAYASAGALAATTVGRGASLAARPAVWGLGWATLDAAVLLAAPSLPLLPVTPGYLLLDGPLVPWAAVAGPVALGAAWVAAGALVAAAAGGFGARWRGLRGWGLVAGIVALGAAALALAADAAPVGATRRVAVAHGVGDADALAATRTDPRVGTALLADLVARASTWAADLHVWPETALGFVREDARVRLAAASGALGAPLLAGAYRTDAAGGWRNAALLASSTGTAWAVDKAHLAPRFEAWLTPGVGERWPVWAAGWRWGVLVCWESLHLAEARARSRDADALVVLAHDGWAGATATPWWHARSGRVLAWATGKPVVVASHDGPSMAWSFAGRLVAEAPVGGPGFVAALASPLAWTTPYARVGPRGVAGAIALAWGLAAAASARRPRQGCGASGPQAA
jgi:apolipoprotein N-acyltransferase